MAFPFSRRTLLRSLGLGRQALAFGDGARFVPGVAQHGGRWDGRLSGLRRLAWELQRRTSVEVVPEARGLALTSPRLFDHPFLYFAGVGEFTALSPTDAPVLSRWAKLLMMIQTTISLTIVVLLAARAVNIL